MAERNGYYGNDSYAWKNDSEIQVMHQIVERKEKGKQGPLQKKEVFSVPF